MNLKKIKYWLQHLDGLWSVPLTFLTFWFIGILIQAFAGYGVGTYDPGFIQPLFLAITVVIGATNAAIGGLNFTFRSIYRYFYGERNTDGNLYNYSKADWTNLTSWKRCLIAFGVFFYYVSAILVVYLKLV
jgi:hypothetical protein